MSFDNFLIDNRIVKAVKKLGWIKPTTVQYESLPKALNNNDLLIQSKTGSGKTAVFAIATLECLLRRVSTNNEEQPYNIHAIIVVPSRELCNQVYNCLQELSQFSRRYVTLINLIDDNLFEDYVNSVQKKQTKFSIVIGTPSRLIKYLDGIPKINLLTNLKQVVFDEADLLFGYGYEDEIKKLLNILSNGNNHKSQTIVVSATLNPSVSKLCDNILNNPISIKLNDSPLPSEGQLSQYIVKCENGDKFLILYALIKLMLLKGRFLIFTNDIQTAFKLKLFLDKFKIYSCVLNNELPFNSRYHIVEYFNSGKLDILIATDQSTTVTYKTNNNESNNFNADKEYSSSRGIDFVKVDNIINFNFPTSIISYVHRVGRTARANNCGIALSLVSPKEFHMLQEVENFMLTKTDQNIRPFSFKIDIVEGFRYRVNDALQTITKTKIIEARRAEIRREILNSERLKEHFKKNPNDRIAIKHDFNITPNNLLQSMGFVPGYLIPDALKSNSSTILGARLIKSKSAGKSTKIKRIRAKNPLKSLKR